ncbi:MAG TPA: class I SAM-dependent methyltransferase [Pyrinomonadaceae bacterium]|nr:class I SAM-dependent methyltransferase [Pyrinomonadaceae bacterium]
MQTDWWENFFHGVALDFWRAAISDEQTTAEAAFIEKQLQLSPGAKVLDVPCGNGRLALTLAARGFQLTGVDLAKEFIEEAKAKSAERDLNIDWYQRDMRDLNWKEEFDGAFCFGNSFGYMDDAANAEFLKALALSIKPAARFVLDAPAVAECVLPNLQPYRLIELGGIKVEIETSYEPDQRRMFNKFAFTRDEKSETRESSQRIYSYQELTDLIEGAGLAIAHSYSSLAGEPFRRDAPRLFLVAVKSQQIL